MSIESAIVKVSQEIGTTSVELAEELALLSAELSYLPDRRMAYDGLAKRTNHPGVRAVATAMVQAEQYGTPLATALRTMAKENRELRLSAAEKKAAALPAQLTVPMILFFLPVLFVVILGPAIIQIQDQMKSRDGQQATAPQTE
jgi:tight adherence protein C